MTDYFASSLSYDLTAQGLVANHGLSARFTKVLSTDGEHIALEFDVQVLSLLRGLQIQIVAPFWTNPVEISAEPGDLVARVVFRLPSGPISHDDLSRIDIRPIVVHPTN